MSHTASHMTPGEPTGTKGGLEVVAANGVIKIENFTGEEEILSQLALHCAGIEKLQGIQAIHATVLVA